MHKFSKKENGFVLPMSVLLMLLLTVSGMNFMHFDFLELRLMRTELDNQSAFYLANAGMERALEAFKIPDDFTWTTVLDDPAQNDLTPDARLCPNNDPDSEDWQGCVIPPFGAAVTTPSLPFEGTFDAGSYQMRAFNNEPGTVDTDKKLTYRALGIVRGEEKLLEIKDVEATTGLRLINCQNDDTTTVCPDSQNKNTTIEHMDGREPASTSELPSWDQDFYRSPGNLPCSEAVQMTGDATLVPGTPSQTGEVQLQNDHCYFGSGNITVQSAGPGWDNIVIFSDGRLLISGDAEFHDAILIAVENIQLQGNVTTRTPDENYPALISGGDITKGNASVQIYGSIFAVGSIGSEQHPWNPNQVEGIIIGSDVYLKAAATTVTDANNPEYYTFMEGFIYPDELKTNHVTSANSWSELE